MTANSNRIHLPHDQALPQTLTLASAHTMVTRSLLGMSSRRPHVRRKMVRWSGTLT